MTGKWTVDLTIEKPVMIKIAKFKTLSEEPDAQRSTKKQKVRSLPIMDDWSFDDGFKSAE